MIKQELSGHNVKVLPGVTFKWGDQTVGRQARVMSYASKYHPDLAPAIYAKGATWYAMRTMRPLRRWNWRVAEAALGRLWDMPECLLYAMPRAPFDPNVLRDYVVAQNAPQNFLDLMPSRSYLQMYYEDDDEATHGDPTAENTMAHWNGAYCFIDWMYHRRAYLPAHRAVDYGKFLQSVIGWHAINIVGYTNTAVSAILKEQPDAWFWCAIHFMRIKARAKSEKLKNDCDTNIDFCTWLKKRKAA